MSVENEIVSVDQEVAILASADLLQYISDNQKYVNLNNYYTDTDIEQLRKTSFEEGYEAASANLSAMQTYEAESSGGYTAGVHAYYNAIRRMLLPDNVCEDSLLSHIDEVMEGYSASNKRSLLTEVDPEELIHCVNRYDRKIAAAAEPVTYSYQPGDEVTVGDYTGYVFAVDEETDTIRGYVYPKSAMQPVPFCLSSASSSVRPTGNKRPELVEIINRMKE